MDIKLRHLMMEYRMDHYLTEIDDFIYLGLNEKDLAINERLLDAMIDVIFLKQQGVEEICTAPNLDKMKELVFNLRCDVSDIQGSPNKITVSGTATTGPHKFLVFVIDAGQGFARYCRGREDYPAIELLMRHLYQELRIGTVVVNYFKQETIGQ